MVDGATRCIKLARDKKTTIDAELQNIVRMKKGVPFKRIGKLLEKYNMQQQQSQRGKDDDANQKNPAGETANSLVEIFLSYKAGIS